MKNSLKLILLGGLLVATGCAQNHVHDTESSYFNEFVPDGTPRRTQDFMKAQAAVGARNDGMLYAWHFDGKDLSPLGREKLASIVDADSIDTITIYVDVKSDTFADRKASVAAYLEDLGVAKSHMNVVAGVNENTLTPVAGGLATYAKTDTAVEASSGSSANSNTSSGSGTGK